MIHQYGSLLVGVIAALAVFAIVYGATHRRSKPVDILDFRLSAYDDLGRGPLTLDEIEMSQPFSDRFVRPFLDKIGARVARMQPKEQAEKLQVMIDLAGRPLGMNAASFTALRISLAVILAIVFAVLALVLDFMLLAGLGVGAIAGYLGPQIYLSRTVKSRQKEIALALPNSLDLLCISVEAGLGFDAALTRVVEKFDNALSREFALALNEIRLGKARQEALRDMGKRSGVPDLNAFIQALIQSDELGVGVSKVLRIQSDELRRRRRQKAEAKAQQASLKMLFPMVGCIFPSLFVILLGPAAVSLIFHVK